MSTPLDEPTPPVVRRRVSRADVAARAGVSHGTVSHVLNHPERVRPELRARVESAIAELGFVRDEAARHLRAGYSTTIGLLLLDAWNPSFIDVARGVESWTAEGPWTVLMSNSGRDTRREQRYLREYAERRVAGLIVIPNDQVSEAVHGLHHDDIPMVLVDRLDHGPGMSIGVDDVLGGGLIADHLLGLGHRNLAFVGDPDAAIPVRARFVGFRERVGLLHDAARLEVIPAPLTVEAGLEVGRQIAARPPHLRPTAIATAVDLLAFGIMQSVQSAGLRVPDDISISGYDDTFFSSQLTVPMTSVARPHFEMGTTAAEMLLQAIGGSLSTPRHVTLTPELVVRASTGSPARG